MTAPVKRLAAFGIAITWVTACLSAFPIELTDGRGRTVTVQQAPQRIVSLAPSTTEIVFALGAGHKLVGRTRFCDYPPKVTEVPIAGAIQGTRSERLLGFKPDLILVSDLTPLDEVERLARLRLPVLVLNHPGLDGILRDIELAGEALGRVDASKTLNTRLRQTRAEVRQRLEEVDPESYPRVLLTFGPLETFSAGGGTYPDRLLGEAGGHNVAREAPSPWPTLSLEAVLEADPQVIFVSVDPDNHPELSDQALLEMYRENDAWKHLQAVKDGRVFLLDADRLNRPGPRAISLLPEVAAHLHPLGN